MQPLFRFGWNDGKRTIVMFRTKQFMSPTNIVLASLIVVALLIGLGMMVVDEAEADHSQGICYLGIPHRSFGMPMQYKDKWIKTVIRYTNCANCITHSTTYPHAVAKYKEKVRTRESWQHYYYFAWRWCHVHYGSWFYTGRTSEIIAQCNRGHN